MAENEIELEISNEVFSELKKHDSFNNMEKYSQTKITEHIKNTFKKAKNGLWYIPHDELEIRHPNFAGGAFSTIHNCNWRGSNVVVKKPINKNINNLLEFVREIEVCSTLRHPNLVQFLGISFNDGELMIILEKITGENLETFINRKQSFISLTVKKHIISQLITTFKFLHNCNPPIIYRDLKPENVLIDKTNNIKLTDFGLSKYFQSNNNEAYMLSGGTGTVRYMAPEVYNNEKYDLTVDVYSLGLIIYYLYTNEKPFRDYSIETIKTYFSTPDLILSTEKIRSKDIKSIINKCIDTQATRRYSSDKLFNAWQQYLKVNENGMKCIVF